MKTYEKITETISDAYAALVSVLPEETRADPERVYDPLLYAIQDDAAGLKEFCKGKDASLYRHDGLYAGKTPIGGAYRAEDGARQMAMFGADTCVILCTCGKAHCSHAEAIMQDAQAAQ
ncbi:MAG: hypothetical protein ACXWP0_10975 [Ktedonobacterales bacterium]